MYNVRKWWDTILKSCSKYCNIFELYPTILGRYVLKN